MEWLRKGKGTNISLNEFDILPTVPVYPLASLSQHSGREIDAYYAASRPDCFNEIGQIGAGSASKIDNRFS